MKTRVMVMGVAAMLSAAVVMGAGPVGGGAATMPAGVAEDTGFYAVRGDVEKGKVEKVEYESKAVGVATYAATVYLPAGYDKGKKYPVLYLIHGANGTEESWDRDESANVVLDNLIGDKKAVPMIVVMPSTVAKGALAGPTTAPGGAGGGGGGRGGRGNMQAFMAASAKFGEVLKGDLIPFIESKYAVAADAEHRAVAGYSAGAAEALNTGLANPDLFAWVAGFSPPINDNKAVTGIKDAAATAKKLRLVWISCGEQDGVINVGKTIHEGLEAKGIANTWHTEPGRHEPKVWRHSLYLLGPLLFVPKG